MAIYLDNNVGLKIATVDLSEYVTSITLTQTFDEVETTSMGAVSSIFKGFGVQHTTGGFPKRLGCIKSTGNFASCLRHIRNCFDRASTRCFSNAY